MEYETSAYNAVIKELDRRQWRYQMNQEQDVIDIGIRLSGRISSVRLYIVFGKSGYMVSVSSPLRARPEQYPDMLRLLNSINCTLVAGNFELKEANGEISYRFYIPHEQMRLSEAAVQQSLNTPLSTFEDWADSIVMILMDTGSVEDALQLNGRN